MDVATLRDIPRAMGSLASHATFMGFHVLPRGVSCFPFYFESSRAFCLSRVGSFLCADLRNLCLSLFSLAFDMLPNA